jgi:hypothetical protein
LQKIKICENSEQVMYSKTIKWFTIGFGAIPGLGWFLSLFFNWWKFGTPFTGSGEWNNFPLVIATLPCSKIGTQLFDQVGILQNNLYLLIILYTLICVVLYALAGFIIGSFVQKCLSMLNRRKDKSINPAS